MNILNDINEVIFKNYDDTTKDRLEQINHILNDRVQKEYGMTLMEIIKEDIDNTYNKPNEGLLDLNIWVAYAQQHLIQELMKHIAEYDISMLQAYTDEILSKYKPHKRAEYKFGNALDELELINFESFESYGNAVIKKIK